MTPSDSHPRCAKSHRGRVRGRAITWNRRTLFDRRYVREESRRAYRLACILFWSLLLYFFCQRYVVSLGIVAERSMLPLLSEGEYFLVNKYIYHFVHPQRGDIVVLRRTSAAPDEYVKRVIGLEGELLLITSGRVYINGRLLTEPYVLGGTFPDVGPYRIAQGSYFVMGDNREQSEDSRQFGSIVLRDIQGKIKPGQLFAFR